MTTTATEVQIEVDEPAKPSALTRKASSIGMNIEKMEKKAGEPKTDIEKEVIRRMKEADTNGDGNLSNEEVTAIIKDLVIEHRSKVRYGLIAGLVTLLLVGSLIANFALATMSNELSKETHAATLGAVATPAITSRRARMLTVDPVKEIAADAEVPQVAMTSKDGKSIVSTKPATETVPLYVAPSIPAEKINKGPVEITYYVYDLTQKTADPSGLKEETMKVASFEKMSDTHTIFIGQDGKEVEVVDGKAYATEKKASVGSLLTSPSLGGSKTTPQEISTKTAGKVSVEKKTEVGARRLQLGTEFLIKEEKSFTAKSVAEEKAPLKQPICGVPTITITATETDVATQLTKLETKTIDKLEKRGADVAAKKAAVRRRQLAATDATAAAKREAMDMTPPACFYAECGSPVGEVLGPVVSTLATTVQSINSEKAYEKCETAKNPACYPCTDSILGCTPVEIEHDGFLKDMNPKKIAIEEAVRQLAPYARESTKEIAGDAEVFKPVNKTKKSTLFVSEKVGAAETEHEELVIFDEGICGVKTKADATKAIKAIAFRGCNETKFTGYYGLEGRAQEMSEEVNTLPAEKPPAKKPAFVAHKEELVAEVAVTKDGRRALVTKTGEEDLKYEYTDDADEPFDGFMASKGKSLTSLTFTREAEFSNETYIAKAGETKLTKMGEGGEEFMKHKRIKMDEEEVEKQAGEYTVSTTKPPQVATLGTRLVGAKIDSKASGMTAITLIYKDDCKAYIADLSDYIACKKEVKEALCNKDEATSACKPANPSEEVIAVKAEAMATSAGR